MNGSSRQALQDGFDGISVGYEANIGGNQSFPFAISEADVQSVNYFDGYSWLPANMNFDAANALVETQHFCRCQPYRLAPDAFVISRAPETGAPIQLWRLSFPGGQLSRLTNDLSDYVGVSMTADRNSLVTMRSDTRANSP